VASAPVVVADGQVIDVSKIQAQIAQAQADLVAARANADNIRVIGEQAIVDATATLNRAPEIVDAATRQSAAADTAAASDVAAKEAALQRLVTPQVATQYEITNAERDVSVAIANQERGQLAGERSENDAMVAVREAAIDMRAKRSSLRALHATLSNANQSLQARSTVRDLAATDTQRFRGRGVQVPADELVFVSSSEVRVSKLFVAPGEPLIGPIMLLSDSSAHVDGGLALRDAALVRPGMTVHIAEPDLGIATDGTVSAVATTPGTNGVDGFHVYFEIDVATPPNNLIGASVRLTIPVESSAGSVLTVPVAALTMAPDGTSRVQLHRGDVSRFVTVQPGLSAHGFVAVRPIGSPLEIGDLVVVGIGRSGSNARA
jgi:hypothetical protein